jgi:regulation of enolase protein 1 (concanavalin A-like superfamily)
MIKNKFNFIILILLISSNTTLMTAQSDLSTEKTKPIPVKSFSHADIGNPAIKGTANISKEGIEITAGGADVWGVKDEFHFAYFERTGDFDLVSRIESLTAPHLYTKAGIMAREDLTENCRHIFFQVFPNNNPRNKNNGGFEFQYRQQKGGEMKAIYPASFTGTPEFPVAYPNTWIRLKRSGNDFTGCYSTDGKNWKPFTTYTLELPVKIYLGLAVTSHNSKESAKASFRDIGEVK